MELLFDSPISTSATNRITRYSIKSYKYYMRFVRFGTDFDLYKDDNEKGIMMTDKLKNKNQKCETFSESDFSKKVKNSIIPLLAVFEADWSGTCQMMTPILEDLCVEYAGKVKIGIIDIDDNVKLVEYYGITSVPSLVFFNNGEIVDHITGSVSRNVITEKLNNIVMSTSGEKEE